MYDLGAPALFLDSFYYAEVEEDSAFVVVAVFNSVLVFCHQTVMEVIFILYEVYLHTCRLYRSNLDDQRMVCIIYDKVHAGKTYNLVKVVASGIDVSPQRRKYSDFLYFVLY